MFQLFFLGTQNVWCSLRPNEFKMLSRLFDKVEQTVYSWRTIKRSYLSPSLRHVTFFLLVEVSDHWLTASLNKVLAWPNSSMHLAQNRPNMLFLNKQNAKWTVLGSLCVRQHSMTKRFDNGSSRKILFGISFGRFDRHFSSNISSRRRARQWSTISELLLAANRSQFRRNHVLMPF